VLGRQPLPDADSWARLGRGPVKGGGGDGGGLHTGVPGGVLAHDVLGPLWPTDGRHPLLMIGCPMGASGFETLASFFPDRTVVTQGPRGIAWGVVPEAEHTQMNAEDVHLDVRASSRVDHDHRSQAS
jgi:hypothetical protein